MKLPAKIFYKGDLVAKLNSFSYDFPWAYGRVSFREEHLFKKACAVTSISDYDLELEALDLSEEDEEKAYTAKLSELGLSEKDLDLDDDGKWSVQVEDKERLVMRAIRFDEKGFVEWRI